MTDDRSVKYGGWERANDVAPVLRISRADGVTPLLHFSQRRRVYEFWRDNQGRKLGRWTWEYEP